MFTTYIIENLSWGAISGDQVWSWRDEWKCRHRTKMAKRNHWAEWGHFKTSEAKKADSKFIRSYQLWMQYGLFDDDDQEDERKLSMLKAVVHELQMLTMSKVDKIFFLSRRWRGGVTFLATLYIYYELLCIVLFSLGYSHVTIEQELGIKIITSRQNAKNWKKTQKRYRYVRNDKEETIKLQWSVIL